MGIFWMVPYTLVLNNMNCEILIFGGLFSIQKFWYGDEIGKGSLVSKLIPFLSFNISFLCLDILFCRFDEKDSLVKPPYQL